MAKEIKGSRERSGYWQYVQMSQNLHDDELIQETPKQQIEQRQKLGFKEISWNKSTMEILLKDKLRSGKINQ